MSDGLVIENEVEMEIPFVVGIDNYQVEGSLELAKTGIISLDHQINSNLGCLACLENCPSFLIPSDLIGYFSSYNKFIESIRVVMRKSNNTFMVIFQFYSPQKCFEFASDFNGALLSSFDNVNCQISFLKSFRMVGDDSGRELCPICLEDFSDANSSPKFFTYCNHCFHTNCIREIPSSQCPVCR